jgi:4-aminobutyrate--pyruvate transaminase
VRAIGDRIAFTPPLIISETEVVDMCSRFGRGLDAAWAALQAQKRLAAE